ncbi:MAG: hypothetical protein P8Y66_09315 [Nitrospirota bacterium]|jgi:non-canonical (house-cleaning) NTP pyrophosphatase
MKRYEPVSLKDIKTYPLSRRKSKVVLGDLATPHEKGGSFREFLDKLPPVLGAASLRKVVRSILEARRAGRPVILAMGAHPIKVGLSPLIIDLMERGIVTALAGNGACIIHDFELAFAGTTSEDVAEALLTGAFGMAEETGRMVNEAIVEGVQKGLGIGESMGEFINRSDLPGKHLSVFGAARRLGLPATVHVTMGADIIHMHPHVSGAATGEGSLRDFRLLAAVVADLEGGVHINMGSAVVMPEVFLKALSVARNLGNTVQSITTVNMDFIQQYRGRENVLRRPTLGGGASYALTGHHEILFPLLAAALAEEWS